MRILKATIDIEVPISGEITEEDAVHSVNDLIWEINAAMFPIRSNKILSYKVVVEGSDNNVAATL